MVEVACLILMCHFRGLTADQHRPSRLMLRRAADDRESRHECDVPSLGRVAVSLGQLAPLLRSASSARRPDLRLPMTSVPPDRIMRAMCFQGVS